jgi:uncharacterized protein (TIGR03086 family)
MTEQDVFGLAQKGLKDVIDQIKDDQWDMKMPADFTRGKDYTLRDIINYHTYDDAWVTETLVGKTIEEVGKKWDGDLLGDDPKASYAKYNQIASDAVAALPEADLDQKVHLSYGDFSTREYLQHIICYRGFRVYTLAQIIGVDTTMPADLVQGLTEIVMPHVEEWRQMGVFGPAINAPENADAQTKLLCAAGFYKG